MGVEDRRSSEKGVLPVLFSLMCGDTGGAVCFHCPALAVFLRGVSVLSGEDLQSAQLFCSWTMTCPPTWRLESSPFVRSPSESWRRMASLPISSLSTRPTVREVTRGRGKGSKLAPPATKR